LLKKKDYYFASFTGILLAIPFLIEATAPLLYISFLPLLFAENSLKLQSRLSKAQIYFSAFFVFHLLSLWWMSKSSVNGYLLTCIVGAGAMSASYILFNFLKEKISLYFHPFLFACTWISYEYMQYFWEFSFPWLNLGNAFAFNTSFIQWYEYTGVLGGSFLAAFINYILFIILKLQIKGRLFINTLILIITIFLQIFISNYLLKHQEQITETITCTAIQSNIDPYREKFSIPIAEQVESMLANIDDSIISQTSLFIFPETAIYDTIDQTSIVKNEHLQRINKYLKGKAFIMGATTYRFYPDQNENIPYTAKKTEKGNLFDLYNSAILIDNNSVQLYNKTHRVPGVEKVPFSQYLPFLENLALDFGGGIGTIAIDNSIVNFHLNNQQLKVAPAICYESIYGSSNAEKIKKGANIFSIITNDGWWGKTQAHKYHEAQACLRAIENRRWVVRSANCGISAIINSNGDNISKLRYNDSGIVISKIPILHKHTFYSKHGDYIGFLSLIITLISVCYYAVTSHFKIKK